MVALLCVLIDRMPSRGKGVAISDLDGCIDDVDGLMYIEYISAIFGCTEEVSMCDNRC